MSVVAKDRVVVVVVAIIVAGQLVITAGETRDDAAIQARLPVDAPANVVTTPLAKLNLVNCDDNRNTPVANIFFCLDRAYHLNH